jgi:hypothetical protein
MNRNLKLISITALFLFCASAGAARVESEDVQNYGANANKTRAVVNAAATPESGRCDFAEPAAIQSSGLSSREAFGRAVCNQA